VNFPPLAACPFVGTVRKDDNLEIPPEPAAIADVDRDGAVFEAVFVLENGDDAPPMITVLTGKVTDGVPVLTAALLTCVVDTEPSLLPEGIAAEVSVVAVIGLVAEERSLPISLLASSASDTWEVVA